MKKYLSKQLMMLAILLLSGIGGVFAQRTITTNYGIPDVEAQTGFATLPDGSVFVYLDASKSVTNAYNGEEYTFKDDIAVSLRIEIGNPVYQLESIKVNDTVVTDEYNNSNNGYKLPDGDLKIDIEFSLIEAKQISVITANFDHYYGNVDFQTQLGGWILASSGTAIKMAKGFDYSMYVYPHNPLCWNVSSVTDNNTTINSNEKGAYSFNNLNEDHTVNVTFEERSSTKNNITVIYNQDYANAGINILNGDVVGEGVGVGNNEPCEAAAGEGFNYRVSIYLKNPQDYVISEIQVGGTGVEFSNTPDGGYFDIFDLTEDKTVTVTIAEREKNTVTVSWVDGCNSIEMYNQYNGYIDPQSYSSDDKEKEGVWVLPAGSTYRLIIALSNPWDYFATVKIGDGDPVNATYNDYYNRYEFDIEALSSDLNIAVSAVAKPTNEIAVSCTYLDALNIEIIDQEYGNLYQLDEDGKVNLKPGKTYRMYINNRVPEVYSLNSIVFDGTTDYVGNFTDENGENDYIEFADLDADHTIAITLDKNPSDTITVNRNGDFVWPNLEKVVDEGYRYGINSKSVTDSIVEWEVLSNQTYRVNISVSNPLIYDIRSVIIDKDTDGEADITENFTDNNNGYNYIEFADISTNHTIDVVAAKQGETKQFTMEAFFDNGNGEERIWYGEYSDIELYDPAKETKIGVGGSFELLRGSTTRLMITPHLGYKVKTVMVDEDDDVTETFNACDGYYEFADLDADHSIKVVFEEASTHYIKVTRDEEVGWFALQAKEESYSAEYNEELYFNEGTNVTMRVDSLDSKWDNENYCWIKYKLTKIMDGETDITPSTSNGNSQYEVFFNNLLADHNVKLIYELIPNYNVTVTFNGIEVKLESSDKNIWISSEEPYKYEVGESVKLILSIGIGQKISVTVNGTPVDYTAGGIVLTDSISEDIVVNITTEEVQTFSVITEFIGYSQGTVYMESDLFEKRETTWEIFNAGSNVTVAIVPSIGYEVSELVLINNDTEVETNVDAVYDEESKEYRYVIENLEKDCRLRITTAKRSMAGIADQLYTLGENGIGTYCSEYDLDFSNIDGITAYIASGFDPVEGYVVLTKVFKVPAGTGIIIKGTPGNYEIPVVATNFYYRNMLVGVVKATPVPQTDRKDVEYANYILLKKDSDTEPTFYRSDGSGDIPANRAYLQIPLNLVPSANNARITTVFEDEVTPVEDILTTSDNSKDDYYNLNGQKVQTVKKGIYIKNGKKVIIR